MSGETGLSLILLIAGSAVLIVTALRIASGKSYSSNPPQRVSRSDNPFSFWLSVLIPGAFATAAVIAGLIGLLFGRSAGDAAGFFLGEAGAMRPPIPARLRPGNATT